MDEAVDKDKHPDRWTHVTNSSPHAKHRSTVVVCLQSLTPPTLGNDDSGVQDLIEFADVEHPSPKCKPFVP